MAKRALVSLLAALAAACHRPPATLPGAEPEIRVGLVTGAATVRLGGDGELFVTDDGSGQPVTAIPVGETWTAVADSAGAGVQLVRPDSTRTESHRGVSVVNVTEDRFAMVNGRRYRGRVGIFRTRGGLTTVNRLPVDAYVAGVLGLELGARRSDELEALLAQAIVSRTFALRNRGRWESDGFDATADTRDQVYFGVVAETPQVWEAVRATAGEVLMYRGELVDAFFHSTCGYSTAGVEEAFKGAQPRPYLKPVSDARGGGHYYCDLSPRFRWREQWDAQQLRAILSRTLPAVMNVGGDGLQRITDVEVTQTTRSGRVGELRIMFERGDVRIPGTDVRAVLRPDAGSLLQSTAFQVTVTKSDGALSRLVAAGAGSGHGVGFCQWGAIGRARAGQRHREILTTYFPGTSVEKLY
ncbi:MAG: hypothetical protein AUI55_06165 [Gemmatimonadetes bacterium 13_1_40CM_2_70_7]|nr:MAG: hypothetical protein AUI55_06165 [Gemmatimonadetes bacterium 13_1_40CM_2_70_7]